MLKRSPQVLPLIALVTLAASPALAGSTGWQEIAPGTKARMISEDSVGLGRTRVGLELELPEGSKTYWRIPGEAGIPTQFDFTGSVGLSDARIDWPFPEISVTDGLTDYVYHGHVVIPIRFAAAGPVATLNVAVVLGVCSEVCVPAQARFTLPMTLGTQDPEPSLLLQMAERTVPIDWDQPQEPFGAITAVREGLTISGIDAAIDPASLIVDLGDPAILFSAPQKSRDGNLWTLSLLGNAGAGALAGRDLQLTFNTRLGPYAVSRRIAPAS